MAIQDQEAIRFVNEQVRPLCEAVRSLKVRIVSAEIDWDRISDKFPKSVGEEIQDGRENEGVSRLTGEDVNNVIDVLLAAAGSVDDVVIAKPCVRAIESN